MREMELKTGSNSAAAPIRGWKVWWVAARPKTLWAAVAPVLMGAALAAGDGAFHLPAFVAALWGAVWIQIGTNYANDLYDYLKSADTEERLGPLRVTQAGLVTPEQMKKAMWIAFALAAGAGIYLIYRGGWPLLAIGTVSILLGVLYTAGPVPLAYTGLADLAVLLFFGPVAVAGTFYAITLKFSGQAVLAGLGPGMLSVAILTVNNLRDMENDRRAGKKTLAVRFGKGFARAEYAAMVLGAGAVAGVVSLTDGRHAGGWLASLIVLAAVPVLRQVWTRSGQALNETLARTGQLLALYAILFSVGWLIW